MIKDPQTQWPDGFPYDHLAAAGIHPDSSMQEVADASFRLMEANDWDHSARDAWQTLRRLPTRLEVDFFLIDDAVLRDALPDCEVMLDD